MQVKLRVSVLIGPRDTTPTRDGTVVDLDEETAKEFIRTGLAVEYKESGKGEGDADKPEPKKPPAHVTGVVRPVSKMSPKADNKMAPDAGNK